MEKRDKNGGFEIKNSFFIIFVLKNDKHMLVGAKEKLVTWWILFILTLFLWYRNFEYDRIIAIFLFLSALIQIFEYSVYCGADPQKEGYKIYLSLWLQCLSLCLAVYIYIKSSPIVDNSPLALALSGWLTFIFALIFIAAILYLLNYQTYISGEILQDGIAWRMNDSNFLGNFLWLYLIGIFAPFILLFAFSGFNNIGLLLLLIYLIAVVLLLFTNSRELFISRWIYFSVGLGFLAWMIGII
jgi:hypothetical protein